MSKVIAIWGAPNSGKSLGVEGIWLSPIFMSSSYHKYDTTNYYKIDPQFGTMDDLQELINLCHQRGVKIILDLVINHTSDEHEWFKQSRSSRDNPYRDYYIWRDPVDGHAPSDNKAAFGGSIWEFDETTGQYYLHLFSKKQPDLNWENPKVRQEIVDMINYWLDMGVAGFRCGWMCLSGDKSRAKGYIEGLNLLANMRLCSNVPGQSIIQTALGGYQSVNEYIVPGGRVYEQREYIYKALNDIPGISAVKPKAAFYIFPNIGEFGMSSEQFCEKLLRDYKCAIVPGDAFGDCGTGFARISYAYSIKHITAALERMDAFITDIKKGKI